MKTSLVKLLLFLAVLYAFFDSPVYYLSDNSYELLMDQAILHYGTPNMIGYEVQHGQNGPFNKDGYLYSIDMIKGRLLYLYPWGGALLSLPVVAILQAIGFDAAPNRVYNPSNEAKMEAMLAALLCTITVWVFYEMATVCLLSSGWSLSIALGAAFGTQIWSSASRSLWSQTWYLLLISVAIWLMMNERIRPILLGSVLAWACFVRPQASPIAVMIGGYFAIEYGRARFMPFVVAGAGWGFAFLTIMMFFFGHLLPPIYAVGLDFPYQFAHRLYGILLGPSRGLLTFVPIVLVPLYLTVRYWRELPRKRFAVLALAAIALHIVMNASWVNWWGGVSYGPRLLTETIPWFVLLAILGIKAFLEDQHLTMYECSAVISFSILLLICSIAINAPGALSYSANNWRDVDHNQELLWDWQHPQFLGWLQSYYFPGELLPKVVDLAWDEKGGMPFRVDNANSGGSQVKGDATDAEVSGKAPLRGKRAARR